MKKKKPKKKKYRYIHRSSETGKFITVLIAAANPRTTQSTRVLA